MAPTGAIHLPYSTRGGRMNVWKRRKSRFYYYRFVYKGEIYERSTGTTNRREALDLAVAARNKIIRQLAGLEQPESSPSIKEASSVRPFESSNRFLMPGSARRKRNSKVRSSSTATTIASYCSLAPGAILDWMRSMSLKLKLSRPGH
jgi:hypothetical protein